MKRKEKEDNLAPLAGKDFDEIPKAFKRLMRRMDYTPVMLEPS